MCQSSYTIEEDSSAKELLVSQMVDISNCQQPAALYRGMALAPKDNLSKQVCVSNHGNPITKFKQVALKLKLNTVWTYRGVTMLFPL